MRSIEPMLRLEGHYVTLTPLVPGLHAQDLYASSHGAGSDGLWQYMRDGPFANARDYRDHLDSLGASGTHILWAIIDLRSGAVGGIISLMKHQPAHRTVELGYVFLLPTLHRTREATEALYLVIRHAMESMNCRRCEWRCDSDNQASLRAAVRLGFQMEGCLRQHLLVRGRSRDTLLLSLIDAEWPARRTALADWLDPRNFDVYGNQVARLHR